MKPIAAEWVEKAEGDLATATRELRARVRPNYDAACFHAQQCAEKYLKACRQEHGIRFEKTHNLGRLLDLLLPILSDWIDLRAGLQELNAYAVAFRYPGDSAGRGEARRAVQLCREVRSRARRQLNIVEE
jgi:HEPN domain-containing protein